MFITLKIKKIRIKKRLILIDLQILDSWKFVHIIVKKNHNNKMIVS